MPLNFKLSIFCFKYGGRTSITQRCKKLGLFQFCGILDLGIPGNLVKGIVDAQGAWYGPGMLKGLPG